MNKKQVMYDKIKRHGEELIKFFNLPEQDPIKLSKVIFSLENKAHHATTCLCNTNTLTYIDHPQPWILTQATEEQEDKFFDGIRNRLAKKIGKENMDKVFINFDPRGYALKIKEQYSKDFYYKDWGGYGILAPDFSDNN